jgi:membrane protease YdiL (CAAX protease family)
VSEERRHPPIPSPLLAFGVTSAALLALMVVAIPFFEVLGGSTAIAMGSVVGLGGIGTILARVVPEPVDVRLGLRPLERRWLLIVLLLVPLLLLTSELDNWIAEWIVRGDRPELEDATQLAILEGAIVTILLLPILEEFFFRGVLLQGVAGAMKPLAACCFTAGLWALFRASLLGGEAGYAASVAAVSLVEGSLLGVLRLASGSLFVPIAFRVAGSGLALWLVSYEEALPIPGFNAPGEHTPVEWLLTAAVPLGFGLVLVRRAWLEREPLPELPILEEDDSEVW